MNLLEIIEVAISNELKKRLKTKDSYCELLVSHIMDTYKSTNESIEMCINIHLSDIKGLSKKDIDIIVEAVYNNLGNRDGLIDAINLQMFPEIEQNVEFD
jgi:hypothetical protein